MSDKMDNVQLAASMFLQIMTGNGDPGFGRDSGYQPPTGHGGFSRDGGYHLPVAQPVTAPPAVANSDAAAAAYAAGVA